ncbi:MAG: hypothetical protein HY044_03050 [Candidatus Woesebacteria bacterium]|nr:MAG: hypothetical protein HY044_03050 [Candidatus Woesebacteria bacterium]
MNSRILILISFFGFLIISFMLLTNHWGIAIRIINYLFFLLLFIVLYEFFKTK